MIEVNDATNIAAEYLKKLFPDANNMQLEEVEISEDEKFWNVTLSYEYYDPANPSAMLFNRKRKYKIFRINANTGDVLSMKIRELS